MKQEKAICTYPFNSAQISMQGDIFVCCPPWCNGFSFGNIYENSFEDIWNGDKAKEFRRQFINDEYKYCNLGLCVKDCNKDIFPTESVPKPETFIFCYDSICNVKCIFCRNEQQVNDVSFFEKNMDILIEDMLENAKNVVLSGVGEALFSPHSRRLIKKITSVFPDIKFSIMSNGILCDRMNLDELGLTDKLLSVTVSLHATKKETYDKLVKNGNFEKVMMNLHFLSDLKKENKLTNFILNFVVNAYNYKEMNDYILLAKKLGATVGFLELLPLDTNKEIFDELNIVNKNHPLYNDFVKKMKNPIFRDSVCTINHDMLNLEPNSLLDVLKNKFLK